MADYTDAEKQTLRDAAFGAVFLVSSADPGMFDMIKESFAASKAFAKASGDLQAVFRGMRMPKVPQGGIAEIEGAVLAALSSATAVVQAKAPAELDAYRQIVIDAATSAAEAAKGVSPTESAALSKVSAALMPG